MAAVLYPSLDQVKQIHDDIIEWLGDDPQPLVRPGDLESAPTRPQTAAFYEQLDLIGQTARLGLAIAQAHAFLDGNKRTAQFSMIVFQEINGVPFPQDEGIAMQLAQLLEAALDPRLSDADAESWLDSFLRQHLR